MRRIENLRETDAFGNRFHQKDKIYSRLPNENDKKKLQHTEGHLSDIKERPSDKISSRECRSKLSQENNETYKHTKADNIDKADYSRPTNWRAGVRDKVWENAKDAHGRVRDPVSGKFMSKEKPWDMGHKPGYEFEKHQKSAEARGIDRKTFIDEYNNPRHLRPELPSSNRSHKGENKTKDYFGD